MGHCWARTCTFSSFDPNSSGRLSSASATRCSKSFMVMHILYANGYCVSVPDWVAGVGVGSPATINVRLKTDSSSFTVLRTRRSSFLVPGVRSNMQTEVPENALHAPLFIRYEYATEQ